jgi:hypothetical protein
MVRDEVRLFYLAVAIDVLAGNEGEARAHRGTPPNASSGKPESRRLSRRGRRRRVRIVTSDGSWVAWLLWPVFVDRWQAVLGVIGAVVAIVVPVVLFWGVNRHASFRRACVAWAIACAAAWVLTVAGLESLSFATGHVGGYRGWRHVILAGACSSGGAIGWRASSRARGASNKVCAVLTLASVIMALAAYVAFGRRVATQLMFERPSGLPDLGVQGQ